MAFVFNPATGKFEQRKANQSGTGQQQQQWDQGWPTNTFSAVSAAGALQHVQQPDISSAHSRSAVLQQRSSSSTVHLQQREEFAHQQNCTAVQCASGKVLSSLLSRHSNSWRSSHLSTCSSSVVWSLQATSTCCSRSYSSSGSSSSSGNSSSGGNSSSSSSSSLLQRVLPPAFVPYAALMRLDKPIGSWLLAWPGLW